MVLGSGPPGAALRIRNLMGVVISPRTESGLGSGGGDLRCCGSRPPWAAVRIRKIKNATGSAAEMKSKDKFTIPPLPSLFIGTDPPSPSTRQDPPRPCPLLRPPLPPTKATLVPNMDFSCPDLLATSCLEHRNLLSGNKNFEICGPFTSCDWNEPFSSTHLGLY
ncbi:hypothetical protein CRG98_004469 [Punica granatum]|uniref:Uncharacterized protein n=1 Tax=Punica granatum TaxID=22663 RepID=A0A2I0L371_PUNGR|nr:hypothetical protein CRG98_004469 [Punica granatum]